MATKTAVAAHGAEIPMMGLGTGRLRGEVLHTAVHAALDLGYRHIDTAAKYGNEADVGEAIAAHATPRADLFITTKALPREDPAAFVVDVEASLRRLRVAQVDLLLIHWPNQKAALSDQIDALCQVRRRGLARHIGLSNFPRRYVDAAVALASEPIVVNQVERHPYLDQTALAETCSRHGIVLMAFCPLGRGALLQEPVVLAIAAAHRRTPAQVVLRWQVAMPMCAVVPSSSQPRRIAENADIFGFELSDEETRRITALARADGRVVTGPPGFDWDSVPL